MVENKSNPGAVPSKTRPQLTEQGLLMLSTTAKVVPLSHRRGFTIRDWAELLKAPGLTSSRTYEATDLAVSMMETDDSNGMIVTE